MPTIEIAEAGCRGCSLCVDTCPVHVFDTGPDGALAVVAREGDCIGCLACFYVCPSRCIEVTDVVHEKPYHRIEEHSSVVEKVLQKPEERVEITAQDWEEARHDVSRCLVGLADTIESTIGRGYKALGRQSGVLAAAHLPEMYEEPGLEKVLAALQKRFRNCFDFDYEISEGQARLTFKPCGLCRVVEESGQKVGEAVLCHLFHEYWAGLVTTFVGKKHQCRVTEAGAECRMELTTSA
jgi:2-oxoglutarate ferredoxin oxidoreductase subunit delta